MYDAKFILDSDHDPDRGRGVGHVPSHAPLQVRARPQATRARDASVLASIKALPCCVKLHCRSSSTASVCSDSSARRLKGTPSSVCLDDQLLGVRDCRACTYRLHIKSVLFRAAQGTEQAASTPLTVPGRDKVARTRLVGLPMSQMSLAQALTIVCSARADFLRHRQLQKGTSRDRADHRVLRGPCYCNPISSEKCACASRLLHTSVSGSTQNLVVAPISTTLTCDSFRPCFFQNAPTTPSQVVLLSLCRYSRLV